MSVPTTPRSRELPSPSAEAETHHLRMVEAIREILEQQGGAISFEQYMQAALYLPELGYYRCGTQKFGAAGDFITAPEISVRFAQCLARFALQTGLASNILEVGAGSGAFAANLLKELQQQGALPEHYYILEVSGELRTRQRETLLRVSPDVLERVIWLDSLPTEFHGVVLANELLDAMPVRRFVIKGDRSFEQYVAWCSGVFCYEDKPLDDDRLQQRIEQLKAQTSLGEADRYLSEINFMAEDWIHTLAAHLQQAVVLLIDYGYPRNAYYHVQRYMGTLMCHYQHRAHPDPLILAGLQDITAYVDFTAMADAALDAGMEVCGFATQAHFLMNQGLLDNIDFTTASVSEQIQATSEIKKLTLPTEMGENFKVMALSKNHDEIVPGFEMFDLRHLL